MSPTHATLAAMAIMAAVSGSRTALAGPCSDDIASLGKTLSQSRALGPATTGALSGSGPEAQLPTASGSGAGAVPPKEGTTAQGKLGGDAGTKEVNAAAGQVAISAQDVRRQQAGLPTQAVDPNAKLPAEDERISRAKTTLEQARVLDQRNDASCRDAVAEVHKLMQPG